MNSSFNKEDQLKAVIRFSDQKFANLLFIPVQVNGKEVIAYFDTGASLSFVSKSLSEELKLPILQSKSHGGNNQGKIFSFPLTEVERILLGSYAIEKLTFGVLPDGALDFGEDENGNRFPASMILGYDVLKDFCFTIHMQRREVVIEPGGSMPLDGSLSWNRFVILEADYLGEKHKIGFDSGHTDTTLDGTWLDRRIDAKKIQTIKTGIGSSSEEDVWVTEKVLLSIKGVEVILSHAEIISGEIKGAESGSLCALLGMDAMEDKVWTMDGKSGYFGIHHIT